MFNERLKELRKQHGYTQKDLAAILGLECSSIGKYETGAAMPTDEVKINMAKLFNVSLDYLLCQSDIPAYTDDGIKDEDIKQLLPLMILLNNQGRQLVLDYAKMLSGNPAYQKGVSSDVAI